VPGTGLNRDILGERACTIDEKVGGDPQFIQSGECRVFWDGSSEFMNNASTQSPPNSPGGRLIACTTIMSIFASAARWS